MQSVAGQIVQNIRKQRKSKEALMLLVDSALDCPRISTQCMLLDDILGGGMPLGRVVEIYGNEGSGKTTVALHLLASAQEAGGIGVMIDVEHALRPEYARCIVPDYKNLIFSQPDSGDEALGIAQDIMLEKAKLAKTKPLVIVVDSVAALASQKELDGELTDTHISPVARLLSESLRRLKGVISRTQTLFVFTNQMRETIGEWNKYPKSTGGRALKFYATIRLEVQTGRKLRKGDEIIGQVVHARVAKNKTYPPFKKTEFRLMYSVGIDRVHSLFVVAVGRDIIKKSGSWFEYGRFKAQGENAFLEKMAKEPQMMKLIQKRLAQ